MTIFSYNSQRDVPAPFALVTIRPHDLSKEASNIPAQVDTGADRTVLPQDLVEALGLPQIGEIDVMGFGGFRQKVPLYVVQVEILLMSPRFVEVAASNGEPHILLGRDVLNHFRVLLDGPRLKMEINSPEDSNTHASK